MFFLSLNKNLFQRNFVWKYQIMLIMKIKKDPDQIYKPTLTRITRHLESLDLIFSETIAHLMWQTIVSLIMFFYLLHMLIALYGNCWISIHFEYRWPIENRESYCPRLRTKRFRIGRVQKISTLLNLKVKIHRNKIV